VTDTNDTFQKLEEKVLRVVEVLKRAQQEKRALLQQLDQARGGTKDQTKRLESLEREVETLRRERDEIRARVEKIIQQIDMLTTPEGGA
jgi:uncharacterized protein YhaN